MVLMNESNDSIFMLPLLYFKYSLVEKFGLEKGRVYNSNKYIDIWLMQVLFDLIMNLNGCLSFCITIEQILIFLKKLAALFCNFCCKLFFNFFLCSSEKKVGHW